jgi:hypothetical protein
MEMTVSLDKKQIHIGWETAVAVIVFLVVTMWGAGTFTAKYLAKQDAIYAAVLQSKREDSIQDVRLDTISMWHNRGIAERNNMKYDLHYIMESLKASKTGYYTERKVNNRLEFNKVK